MKNLISLTFLMILTTISCNPDECSPFNVDRCTRTYEINVPFELGSDSITYSVGDTFEVKMTLPDSILDVKENQMVDISDFIYRVTFSTGQMHIPYKRVQASGHEDFQYFDTDKGRLQGLTYGENTYAGDLIFDKVPNGRECVFKVQCQRPGIFYFLMQFDERQLDEAQRKRPVLNFTDTCCREIVEINNVLTNNFENHNYHLITSDLDNWHQDKAENFPFDFYDTDIISRGIFLLEVVE